MKPATGPARPHPCARRRGTLVVRPPFFRTTACGSAPTRRNRAGLLGVSVMIIVAVALLGPNPSQCATPCSSMTFLANRTPCRHDETRALNTFNRAAAFHAMSA